MPLAAASNSSSLSADVRRVVGRDSVDGPVGERRGGRAARSAAVRSGGLTLVAVS